MSVFRAIDVGLADASVKLCLDLYTKLSKNGKPTKDEWTVFAAVVEEIGTDSRIVSFGTGSKCLGRNLLSAHGELLHDSHAEVVARRNFLVYLYSEILSYRKNGVSEVLEEAGGKLKVKLNVRFGFVSSAVPCGDAAIIPVVQTSLSSTNAEQESTVPPKRPRLVKPEMGDIHRTGAKCLPGQEKQDPKLPGADFHSVGAVRTKPGRGDPTASVSCSDKLARWNVVGVQGALLSLLLEERVYFEYIIIGGGGPFSLSSMERAINQRVGVPKKTAILQSNISFGVDRSDERIRPSPSSISWNIAVNKTQVCVEGRRLGATKKRSMKFALDISKVKLLELFKEAAEPCSNILELDEGENVRTLTYRQLKNKAVSYQSSWKSLRENFFKVWTEKPDGLENFNAMSSSR